MTDKFDYIVVGAGSAGSVIAGKLARDTSKTVLLLEAGSSNNGLLVNMPKGIGKLVNSPRHAWTYGVAGERLPGQPPEVWIRGKGLGGSSAINGMIWSRGHPEDFDRWQEAGCTGWNWESMKAAYKALEDHQLGATDAHGAGGPVAISSGTFKYPLTEDMIAAGEQMGLQRLADLNDKPVARVGYYSHNIRRGRRVSAAHAFIEPVRHQPNLTILTRATVQRVLMSGKRATGVSVLVKGALQQFQAAREVVICGGLLESPRLLQLSGIGPADVLAAADVDLVHESPDVGRRMLEHLSLAVPFRINSTGGSHRNFFGPGLVKSALQYQLFKTGSLATGPFEVGAFANVSGHPGPPNLQLYLGGYVFALTDDNHPVPLSKVDREPGLSIYLQILQLTSEGSLRISSADPAKPALIDPNWLATPEDRQLAIDSVRYVREYAAQPALSRHIVRELLPGEHCQSDQDVLHAFRKMATSGLHGTGTCRMGGDDAAVVDSELRVKGIEGLRVADCSVMPNLVSGNTNAPAMALGYRAADIIRAEHG